jgi:glycerophosphoryl diester phosphodiesterase
MTSRAPANRSKRFQGQEKANAHAAAEPTSAATKSRPLLLGHRGARPLSRFKSSVGATEIPPENTIACFEYAFAHGCDGVEFDVRATRDERLVICHNVWLRGRKVSASSFDSLCSRCGTRLPCLEDVLRAFADRAYLNIEVKVPGTEELIVNALRLGRPQRYLVSSFSAQVLRRLHQLDPSLPLGYVCDRTTNVRTWRDLPIEVFLPHYELASEKLVQDVHSRGLQIFTWTVNQEKDLLRLAGWGIDGFISDDPNLLDQTFASDSPSLSSEK